MENDIPYCISQIEDAYLINEAGFEKKWLSDNSAYWLEKKMSIPGIVDDCLIAIDQTISVHAGDLANGVEFMQLDYYTRPKLQSLLKWLKLGQELNDTFTFAEVVALLLTERKRGMDIADTLHRKHTQTAKERKAINDKFAFKYEVLASECLQIANIISGITALGATLGKTVESEIRHKVETYLRERNETT